MQNNFIFTMNSKTPITDYDKIGYTFPVNSYHLSEDQALLRSLN